MQRAKEAAEAANRSKSEFLANMSHDYVSKPIRTEFLRDEMERMVQCVALTHSPHETQTLAKDETMILDRENFLNRVEHDEELARELLGIFQTESVANRETLRSAVEARNADAVRNSAHAFKGLANLAANKASAAAAQLEALAKEGQTDALASAWQEFDMELSRVVLEVEHLLAGAMQ
jgi:HPt (histidine-containing phosphotransfer) domain-containing protein